MYEFIYVYMNSVDETQFIASEYYCDNYINALG